MAIKYVCKDCGMEQGNASLVCSVCGGSMAGYNVDIVNAMMWEQSIRGLKVLVFDNPLTNPEYDFEAFNIGSYE